jgi:putative endonuclease
LDAFLGEKVGKLESKKVGEWESLRVANTDKLYRLVYFEEFQYIDDAIKREKQLKNWHRQWKINLIEEHNPSWEDLWKLRDK